MKRSTTSLSRTCDRTGTIEIGLWSLGPFGGLFFATGRIRATRHCSGIVEEFNDELNSLAIHPEMTGASSRRNQAGMLSIPSAVGLRLVYTRYMHSAPLDNIHRTTYPASISVKDALFSSVQHNAYGEFLALIQLLVQLRKHCFNQ